MKNSEKKEMSESERWLENLSSSGNSMAAMMLHLVEGFDPDVRKQYIDMAHDATKNALTALEKLSDADLEKMRANFAGSKQDGR